MNYDVLTASFKSAFWRRNCKSYKMRTTPEQLDLPVSLLA